MTETEPSLEHFSSRFEVVVYTRPTGDAPEQWRQEDWRELDRGPGYFTIPAGQIVSVRIHGIDDDALETLVEELAPCKVVLEVSLAENRKVTDAGIACLTGLRQVISLNLSSCGLTSTGMKNLVKMRQLERLNLSYCNRITDAGLKLLKDMPALRYLDLQGCVKITNGGIAHVRRQALTIHRS
jgi:hypothetical protein